MKKNSSISFQQSVQKFFQDYLVKERGVSHHTIRSYRDTFISLIDYFDKEKRIAPEKVDLEHINRVSVSEFLNWLEEKKGNTGNTRNQRFTAIRSYCHYMLHVDPMHLSNWSEILSIRQKKFDSQSLNHLTIEAIGFLLKQIDISTKNGRRDLTLLTLLYNSAARVQEIIDLTPASIHLNKPCLIEVFGKGRKKRNIPIDETAARLIDRYMAEEGLNSYEKLSSPLFHNQRGDKLTTPGINYIITKYVDLAKQIHPEYYSINVTPHVFRHSRAMHLLEAGVNLIYIKDLLGHSSVQTTEIYAKANLKHVRTALENAYSSVGITEPQLTSWEKDPEIKKFLKSFC